MWLRGLKMTADAASPRTQGFLSTCGQALNRARLGALVRLPGGRVQGRAGPQGECRGHQDTRNPETGGTLSTQALARIFRVVTLLSREPRTLTAARFSFPTGHPQQGPRILCLLTKEWEAECSGADNTGQKGTQTLQRKGGISPPARACEGPTASSFPAGSAQTGSVRTLPWTC